MTSVSFDSTDDFNTNANTTQPARPRPPWRPRYQVPVRGHLRHGHLRGPPRPRGRRRVQPALFVRPRGGARDQLAAPWGVRGRRPSPRGGRRPREHHRVDRLPEREQRHAAQRDRAAPRGAARVRARVRAAHAGPVPRRADHVRQLCARCGERVPCRRQAHHLCSLRCPELVQQPAGVRVADVLARRGTTPPRRRLPLPGAGRGPKPRQAPVGGRRPVGQVGVRDARRHIPPGAAAAA